MPRRAVAPLTITPMEYSFVGFSDASDDEQQQYFMELIRESGLEKRFLSKEFQDFPFEVGDAYYDYITRTFILEKIYTSDWIKETTELTDLQFTSEAWRNFVTKLDNEHYPLEPPPIYVHIKHMD